jgi:hypothetical protein
LKATGGDARFVSSRSTVPLADTAYCSSTWIAMMFAMYESSQKIVGYDSRSRGSVECDSTQKTIGCAGGRGRSVERERRSGWEVIGWE